MNERKKLSAKYSGWPPKHLLDALDEQQKPAEDKPKRGRRPKVQEDVSQEDLSDG